MGPHTPLIERAMSLAASGGGGTGLFLLVDQSAFPRMRSLWPRLSGQRWAALLPSGDAQPDGATPLLVDVSRVGGSAMQRRALNEFYTHGRWANGLALLASALPLDALASALMARARAELPDRLSVVLRYFDTRVVPLLPRLLSSEQYAAFMDGIDAWHFVDREGALQALPPAATRSASRPGYPPLVFDTLQERMLIDDGNVDAIIDRLLELQHPALLDATPPQQHALTAALVEAAGALEITELHDLLPYCCAALAQGPGFERRAPWANRLAQHREGRLRLEEALADAY